MITTAHVDSGIGVGEAQIFKCCRAIGCIDSLSTLVVGEDFTVGFNTTTSLTVDSSCTRIGCGVGVSRKRVLKTGAVRWVCIVADDRCVPVKILVVEGVVFDIHLA